MRSARAILLIAAVALLAAGLAACGDAIRVAKTDPPDVQRGAVLFSERCSGCHTLGAAGTEGSKPERLRTQSGERTNGPNFNSRTETRENVLFAIRNGGFSGAIMPSNVVVGQDAQDVAAFVSKYAGKKR